MLDRGLGVGRRVLVIGAGPSGVSAAYHLARLGHEVEIRDAGERPGGMMRYAIPAYRMPRDVLDGELDRIAALGVQTCFFAISSVLPRDEAIAKIKAAIAKTYGRRGAEVVARNHAAVDTTLEGLHQIEVPGRMTSARELPAMVPAHTPEFVRAVTAMMMAGRGDELPVSMLPADGTYPSGTTAYEKRNISELVAEWDPDLCIQCGNCSFVCPHSVIRATYYDESLLEEAPPDFKSAPLDARGMRLQSHAARSDAATAEQVNGYADALDQVIARIRTSIFGLRHPRHNPGSLPTRVVQVIDEHAPQLGFTADVSFTGPLDLNITPALADDILAVTRDALSDCARHAHATAVGVSLALQDGLFTLDITDNGCGPGTATRAGGLTSMRHRAERNGGTFQVTAPGSRGTHLTWTARSGAP